MKASAEFETPPFLNNCFYLILLLLMHIKQILQQLIKIYISQSVHSSLSLPILKQGKRLMMLIPFESKLISSQNQNPFQPNPTFFLIPSFLLTFSKTCMFNNDRFFKNERYNIQRKHRMGDTVSVQSQSNYPSTLTFIQSCQDRNFGHIDIFRTKQAPYEYVMDFKKNFIEDNQRMNKYIRLVSQIKNMDHKNIAKIHHSQLIQENQMCIKHKKIHTFCNYYNFTLEAAIDKKKIQDAFFPQTELIYIMGALLQAAGYLQKYGISLGQYRTRSIYLSPEGYIKLYLLEVEEDNKHSCYFKVSSQREQIDNYILSPQQLYHINNLQYQIKYDVYKSDVFTIAMVILQLITLDKSKFYYNQAKTELKIDRISFDISSMGKNYSQAFIGLLKHCLQPVPNNRCNIQQATQQLNIIRKSMKSITYCIRLQEEEDKGKKSNFKREITMSAKGQHILNGLQKKLTPSPITTLSSSLSTNFRVQSKTNSSRGSQVGALKI